MHVIELYGYRYSVYTWIVRAALCEKGIEASFIEVNPFAEGGFALHPFGRVPLIDHAGFRLYETNAITRYIDAAFDGQSLQPGDARQRARSDQIVGIVDSYAYWPLVRQVFVQGYFEPVFNSRSDRAELALGLSAAPAIISALDELVADQGVLKTATPSLGDLHLAPMISYFSMAPEGADLISASPAMARWWETMSVRTSVEQTRPDLPPLAA